MKIQLQKIPYNDRMNDLLLDRNYNRESYLYMFLVMKEKPLIKCSIVHTDHNYNVD